MKRSPYFPEFIHHIPTKRLFDIFFSLLVLGLLAPLFLLIATGIVVTTRSFPLYRQKRVGRGGRIFSCYKFRTMVPHADQVLTQLIKNDPMLAKEWQEHRKLKNDPRVTAVGRLLRKTSLDELPQFFNVLKGDLSVVGPRAVVMDEIETHFKEKAQKILRVRPGITGLWQVSGRSDITYEKRICLDETYVNERTLLLDLKIVAKTIPVMFNQKGAY